MLEPSVR